MSANMILQGERKSGKSVRSNNVTAAVAVANIVKSSLGPVGLDKMLVDDVGDVTVTNDGATILKLLDVEHPAAKVLVELADLQDQEVVRVVVQPRWWVMRVFGKVGDGTTSVVIVAAELLKNADQLAKDKIHPTSIISGYKLACKEAVKYIQEHLTLSTDDLGKEVVLNAAKTSMSSKIIGSDKEFFAKLVVDAMLAVKRSGQQGETKYPVKSVNILKAHGGSAHESRFIDGYALNCTVASQAMVKKVAHAKIACLDFNLMKARMKLGVQVLVSDPEKLQDIRKREADITKERIHKILKTGANVILTTQGIDDLCLKYFVEAGAMAVRRVGKEDIKRIARATGATLVLSLSNMEGEEAFEAAMLGGAELVSQERVSDEEFIIISKPKAKTAASILLRGANDFMLDEIQRSVHDALCVVKRVLESKKVVPGGGAVEVALSVYLDNFARQLASREQLAIAAFAQALLVIPKTLAVNAAQDAVDLTTKLCALHHASQTIPDKVAYKYVGLDLVGGVVRDSVKAGVLEPAMSKIKSLKFATEAAITILRIDDMITHPKEQQQDGSAYQQAMARGDLDGHQHGDGCEH